MHKNASHLQKIVRVILGETNKERLFTQQASIQVQNRFLVWNKGLSSIGFGSVIVLYAIDRPLCCNSILIGYYLATSFFVQAVGAVLGLKFLRIVLSEVALMQAGIISVICSLVMMAFAKTKTHLFIGRFKPTS